ncbi:MAG: universal stress protein, partial [Polyangiaceae bacterium]|nr:universal stress protein [Polyangiaceae bacterium]
MERLLLPYDGSPTAAAIVPRIRGWLAKCHLEVVVLRIVDLQSAGAAAYPIEGVAAAGILAELEKEAQRSADGLVADLRGAGLTARAEVAVGRPVSEILDAAERLEPAFIALSTHGRTGLARWAFGSVTEKVLRKSRHPLLVLPSFTRHDRERVPQTAELAPRHILVPIDGSELARDVAPHATAFAKLFGADITVIHVVPPGLGDMPRPLASLYVETARDEYRGVDVWADTLLRDG